MATPAHSPTPWKSDRHGIIGANGHDVLDGTYNPTSEPDLAFIVRAANAYEALADFALGNCPHGCSDGNCPFDRAAKAAITKAVGKP